MQQTYRHVHEERIEAPGEQAAVQSINDLFKLVTGVDVRQLID